MALTGSKIALAEGRQLEDLAQLLEKEGATPLRYPLLSILDPLDDAPVTAWLREVIAGGFTWVILLTGEGLRRMVTCAERHGLRDDFVAALGKVKTLTRGPKPGRALQEIGLKASRVASAPTTEGVIATLADEKLAGLTVGVQLYREDNPPLITFLAAKEAIAKPVTPYRYAPASDAERVIELIGHLSKGEIDGIIFTSAPQIERLFDVALEAGLNDALRSGLAKTKVAAVGPLMSAALTQRKVRVDICPEQGWQMKNLVQQIKRAFGE